MEIKIFGDINNKRAFDMRKSEFLRNKISKNKNLKMKSKQTDIYDYLEWMNSQKSISEANRDI